MTSLTKTQSGIVYPSPSDEFDPIVLEGKDWYAIIQYRGNYHPMLPLVWHWSTMIFNKKDME